MKIPLEIGDQPFAIRIIQESQTDPNKALAEFVENAIDAGAKNCEITRKKIKGKHGLIIRDDGQGFSPDNKGIPDFKRVARSICDSIKKHFSEKERATVQGQFGIGILGFAAIGETLTITSKATSDVISSLTLKKGSIACEINERKLDAGFKNSGSEILIWPIHKEVQSRLTPPKIAKYLGEELRDRILQTQINITANDPHTKKRQKVVPRKFEGERLRQFDKVKTRIGINTHFNLYIANLGETGSVYISRRGTKVIDDITALPEFDCDPWNRGLLEGYIDFKALNISPATRRGIIADEAFEAFVEVCRGVEPDLIKVLDDVERKRKETANPKLVRKIQQAFKEIMKEVGEEYDWFGGPGSGPIPKETGSSSGKRKGYVLSNGPLHEVRIIPKIGQVKPNETRRFQARALDAQGGVIPIGIKYYWSLDEIIGTLKQNGNEVDFSAFDRGDQTKLRVIASNNGLAKEAEAIVLILQQRNINTGVSLNLSPIADPRGPWRSRFRPETKELQYNTGHPDFKAIQKKGSVRVVRYIGQLVARHLVLYNFKHADQEEVLERMLEIMSKFELKL